MHAFPHRVRPGDGVPVRESAQVYIEVGRLRGATILKVKGELDGSAVEQLRDRIDTAISRGVKRLVIDLGDVEFLGFEGIDMLVNVRRALRLGAGTLVLANAPEQARVSIHLKGLVASLPFYPAVGDAVDAIEAGQ